MTMKKNWTILLSMSIMLSNACCSFCYANHIRKRLACPVPNFTSRLVHDADTARSRGRRMVAPAVCLSVPAAAHSAIASLQCQHHPRAPPAVTNHQRVHDGASPVHQLEPTEREDDREMVLGGPVAPPTTARCIFRRIVGRKVPRFESSEWVRTARGRTRQTM